MDKFYSAATEESKYGIPDHFPVFTKPFSLRLWDVIEAASYGDVKRACENIVKNEYHFQFTYCKWEDDRDSKLISYQAKVADIVAILTTLDEYRAPEFSQARDHMNQWLFGYIQSEFQFAISSTCIDYSKSDRIRYTVFNRPLAEYARNTDIVYMGRRNEKRTDYIEELAEKLEEESES